MKEKLSNIKFEDDGYFSKHRPFDDMGNELEGYPLITSKHMDLKIKGFKYKMSKNGVLTFKSCSLTHNRIVSNCGSDTWVFPELSFNTKHLNPEKAYNIYALCSKETNSGTWKLEEDYLKDFSETHYNFKIGVLYCEQDGLRDVEFSTNIFPFTSIKFEDGKIIMTTDSLVYKEEDDDNPVVDWGKMWNKKEKEEYRLGCPPDPPLKTTTVDELSDLFLSLMTEKTELDTSEHFDKLNHIIGEPTKSGKIQTHAQPFTCGTWRAGKIATSEGVKDSSGKLEYEIDFAFITQIAERMAQNKGKYAPFNWQKPIDIDKIKQAMFRHAIAIMQGEYEDDGRPFGHIEGMVCNAMILNYHLK